MKSYYEHAGITIYHGDCLEIMPTLPAASVDLVLCDLPYGTTACKWDVIIPFVPLWVEYRRLVMADSRRIQVDRWYRRPPWNTWSSCPASCEDVGLFLS